MTIKLSAITLFCAASTGAHAALVMGLNANDLAQLDGSEVTFWSGGGTQNAFAFPGFTTPNFVASSAALNGNSAVRFDALNDGMGTTVAGLTANNYTVMSLYSANNITGTHRVVQGSANWLIGPYNGKHNLFNGGFASGPTAVIGTPVIVSGAGNGLWVNGTNYGNGTNATSPGSIGLGTVGAYAESAASDVGLVLIFNTQLTADERVGVEYRMAQAYGMSGFTASASQIAAADFQLGGFLSVPEPTCISLLGIGVLGLLLRRRK